VLLSNEKHFLPFLARAMTYVDVQMLSRDELLSSCEGFPDAVGKLRRHTILLALKRYIIGVAKRNSSESMIVASRRNQVERNVDTILEESSLPNKQRQRSSGCSRSPRTSDSKGSAERRVSGSAELSDVLRAMQEQMTRSLEAQTALQEQVARGLQEQAAMHEQMRELQASVAALTTAQL
jgi:hypothetical protein